MKVLVIASHSGGHISPAIAFCESLKDKDKQVQINFVTTKGQIEKKLLDDSFQYLFFERKRITILNILYFFSLFINAHILIKKLEPNLVVGFGGYLSIPFIICAHFKKIPNFIHEQNKKIGLANWFLAKFSDKIVFTFPDTQFDDRIKNKALILGIPLRKELIQLDKKESRRYLGLDTERFTILVMGGSQGSTKINTQIIQVLKDKEFYDSQVIHITGFFDYERITQEYENLNIKYLIFPFAKNMQYLFSACDIVISRAGANTIAEIITFKIPSIMIPYPYAKQHQLDNAHFLSDNDAAILIEDRFCSSEILKEKILYFKNNPARLNQMSRILNTINIADNSARIVELALNFAK